MKYQSELRDPAPARALARAIERRLTRSWTLMEVCGGQTHAILRFGLDELLPPGLELIHGPGCPVCVTPVERIDQAIAIARTPGVVFCSFGDMLRVPGSRDSLFQARAEGADVRMLYSPLDALALARAHPDRQVVFFAVGFETTAPGNAMAVLEAERLGVENFSVLVSHVLVPPALRALLSSPSCRIDGFLAAGHVCAVMGLEAYRPIAREHHVPIVVTGFEPLDILQGVLQVVAQLEEGRAEVENAYARVARDEGNRAAQAALRRVFQVVHRAWRGIGTIPESGWALAPDYARFDAERRFDVTTVGGEESPLCISGRVLQGLAKPSACSAFGSECTPDRPLGAPMVSSEGACAAYFRFGRRCA